MKKSFSLVEMLVVIAIIAILLTFLLPGLGKARAQARSAQCSAQMHQIGLANQMYLSDNSNYYSPKKYQVGTYYDSGDYKERNANNYLSSDGAGYYGTNTYLDYQYIQKKETFICPSSNETDDRASFGGNMTYNWEINNEANQDKDGQKSYLKSLHIRNTSEKIITVDTGDAWLKTARPKSVTIRHQGQKINHLWADGHGSTLRYSQLLANPQWLTPLENEGVSWGTEGGDNSFTFE